MSDERHLDLLRQGFMKTGKKIRVTTAQKREAEEKAKRILDRLDKAAIRSRSARS